MIKLTAITIALVLVIGSLITPTILARAQNETIGEETPTLNMTVPEESTIEVTPDAGGGSTPPGEFGNDTTTGLTGNETTGAEETPIFPSGENVSVTTEPAQNLTEVKEQAIDLLDTAETNIQDARDLIQSLQEALAAAQAGGNETEEIIIEANDSATDIIDVIQDEVNDTATVDEAANVTEDVITVINDTIAGNTNATVDQVQNASDTVVDVIEEVTDALDNGTAEAQVQSGLIRLLTGLVNAQDYNQNLTQEDKDNLKANLQDTIAEQAESAADALRG